MRNIILVILIFISGSCKNNKVFEQNIVNNLNKEIDLKMIDVVYKNNQEFCFEYLYDDIKYIYLVYLQSNCSSCYFNFIDIQEKFHSLNSFDFVTVLFVIKGDSYHEFIKKVRLTGLVKERYYIFMDQNDLFKKRNESIPEWIIENSILINAQRKIVMIGSPFSTPEMSQIFYDICSK